MFALAGLVALVVALLTGSTPMAVVVIALAVGGIVALVRDWRAERGGADGHESQPPVFEEFESAAPGTGVAADDLSPDISGDPDGPSSDARAD